jgi:hypothetical protein
MAASRQQGRCLGAYEHLYLAVTHQLVDANEDLLPLTLLCSSLSFFLGMSPSLPATVFCRFLVSI